MGVAVASIEGMGSDATLELTSGSKFPARCAGRLSLGRTLCGPTRRKPIARHKVPLFFSLI